MEVEFLVGARHYYVSLNRIKAFPDSYFAVALSPQWQQNRNIQSKQQLQIEGCKHSELFEHIVHYVQHGCVARNREGDCLIDRSLLPSLREDADYFCLSGMVSEIDALMTREVPLVTRKLFTVLLGSKFPAVEGRVCLITVTLRDIILDYNYIQTNNIPGYCFLKVLPMDDKLAFMAVMTRYEALHCYKTRSMTVTDWITIMERTELHSVYRIYRYAYWGEAGGSTNITTRKSHMMVLLRTIKGKPKPETSIENIREIEQVEEATSCLSSWFDIKKQKPPDPTIDILIHNNHMCLILKKASADWANHKYELNENEIEVR